jgi:nucleoside-diphosphate-sugar epimerase
MTVGVTGGTGFIGSTLVRRLVAEGCNVRLLSRQPDAHKQFPPGVEFIQGDLNASAELLRPFAAGVEVLYHCAAEINDTGKMASTNVEGTRNLANAAAGSVGHWVQLSSIDTYGTQTDGIITEGTPKEELNFYEQTKIEAENIVIQAAAKHGFTYTILRPSKVYGPDMRNALLFKLISLIDRGLFFYIGRPGASANYIHVDDVVEAMILGASKPAARNRDYNVSDYCSMEELVGIISSALGRPTPTWRVSEYLARAAAKMTSFVPRNLLTVQRVNAMVKRARYSTARIEAELGFRPRVSMKDGLEQLVHKWQGSAK